jgi:hypothetical protein
MPYRSRGGIVGCSQCHYFGTSVRIDFALNALEDGQERTCSTANMATSTRLCSVSLLRRRRFNIFFLLCVFLAFMKAGLYAANKRSDRVALSFTNSLSPFDKSAVPNPISERRHITPSHPIPKLMDNAESAFRSKIARQSKTLQAAVAEYRRRYGRPPPKGFDDWWNFAKERNVIMVDEYDGLVRDLEPFWDLPGNVFRRRAVLVSFFAACSNEPGT